MNSDSKKEYLTPAEVASLLMVSPVTVRQWSQKGQLEFEQTPGGHRRYRVAAIKNFAREHNIQLHNHYTGLTRILIVDDNPQICSYLSERLAKLSPQIKTDSAENGFEAGQKIETFKPNILLLDLVMPDLDGFQVCRQIKQNPSINSIRIIAMTGYPSAENVNQIINNGAETCLAKPVNDNELIKALKIESTITLY